jgi:hypothetical protein
MTATAKEHNLKPLTMVNLLLRHRSSALLAAALLAFTASLAVAGPGGTDRPHLGQCDTVIPPAPTAFPAVVEIGVTCRFRHLGYTTGTIIQTLDVAGPPSNGVLPLTISEGRITYIAANGDELHTGFEGTASIDFASGTIEFQGIETIGGGTGRFSGASGTSYLEGNASALSLTGFYITIGSLSY